MPPANLHASALLIGDRGIVVAGPSGSGKTVLCLALLNHCRNAGLFARLVSDDQTYVMPAGGRLIARAPEPIAGLIEVRGLMPTPIGAVGEMIVDRMVRLVPAGEAPRFSEGETELLEGRPVPCLRLPERNALQGASTVGAWLGLAPFATE
ncbi:MAG: HPr kinase/phosphatase C-terminal domain-containing protein [Rhizobiaceae bacterium]